MLQIDNFRQTAARKNACSWPIFCVPGIDTLTCDNAYGQQRSPVQIASTFPAAASAPLSPNSGEVLNHWVVPAASTGSLSMCGCVPRQVAHQSVPRTTCAQRLPPEPLRSIRNDAPANLQTLNPTLANSAPQERGSSTLIFCVPSGSALT